MRLVVQQERWPTPATFKIYQITRKMVLLSGQIFTATRLKCVHQLNVLWGPVGSSKKTTPNFDYSGFSKKETSAPGVKIAEIYAHGQLVVSGQYSYLLNCVKKENFCSLYPKQVPIFKVHSTSFYCYFMLHFHAYLAEFKRHFKDVWNLTQEAIAVYAKHPSNSRSTILLFFQKCHKGRFITDAVWKLIYT